MCLFSFSEDGQACQPSIYAANKHIQWDFHNFAALKQHCMYMQSLLSFSLLRSSGLEWRQLSMYLVMATHHRLSLQTHLPVSSELQCPLPWGLKQSTHKDVSQSYNTHKAMAQDLLQLTVMKEDHFRLVLLAWLRKFWLFGKLCYFARKNKERKIFCKTKLQWGMSGCSVQDRQLSTNCCSCSVIIIQ